MTEMKHTPGPWRMWLNNNGRAVIGPSTNYAVAEMFRTPMEGQEPNARLIAAAPDLLAACRLAVAAMGNMDAANVIRAAIAKATGA